MVASKENDDDDSNFSDETTMTATRSMNCVTLEEGPEIHKKYGDTPTKGETYVDGEKDLLGTVGCFDRMEWNGTERHQSSRLLGEHIRMDGDVHITYVFYSSLFRDSQQQRHISNWKFDSALGFHLRVFIRFNVHLVWKEG